MPCGKRAEKAVTTERIARINRIADRIVGQLDEAINALDPTDTQKLRHVVSAVKEIKALQSLSLGDEAAERELKLRELRSKVECAESEASSDLREITVHIDGDDGYSD